MNTEDIMDLVREYGSARQSGSFAYECGDLGGSKRYDEEADKLLIEIEEALGGERDYGDEAEARAEARDADHVADLEFGGVDLPDAKT